MRTFDQIVATYDTTDRRLIRSWLDHNNRPAAFNYVRSRGHGPVMTNAIINHIGEP